MKKGSHVTEEHKKRMKFFLKGHTPWNKGKNPEYVQGMNHPLFGKKHSIETRNKMSLSWKNRINRKPPNWDGGVVLNCVICMKEFTVDKYRKDKSKYCSGECFGKATSKRLKGLYGENSGAWKGGLTSLSELIKKTDKYSEWRMNIFIRDNRVCQECGNGNNIEGHHKKSFKRIFHEFLSKYNQFSTIEDKETLVRLAESYEPFWDLDNGQTLCKECHKLTPNYSNREKLF